MMDQQKMRDTARELLQKGEVKYLFGYESCDFGSKIRPVMIQDPADVDKLIFTPMCKNNLSVYLTLEPPLKKGEKMGLIAKGCDGRALNQILQEHGIKREEVVVLGVPCSGIIDPEKLYARVPEEKVVEAILQGDNFTVRTRDGEKSFPKNELIFNECIACGFPTPTTVDVLLGEAIKGEPGPQSTPLDKMGLEERWAFWSDKFKDCVRCYACRNICPLCFSEECAVDSLRPNWVRRSVNLTENAAWHILRAFHLAGRCIGCGECARACPTDIPLNALNRILGLEAFKLFEYIPGIDPEAKPLLTTYGSDDEEGFIL